MTRNSLRNFRRPARKQRALDSEWKRQLELEILESRALLAVELLEVVPNVGDPIQDGTTRTVAPRELTFRFSHGEVVDPSTVRSITVSRSGFDGSFGEPNDVLIPAGFLGVGQAPNEVILRFAESLPDDAYRIHIDGSLTFTSGRFRNGNDQAIDFQLELGAQIVAVVPQPVLRQQVLEVLNVNRLRDGDRLTVHDGSLPLTFEFNSGGGVSGIAIPFTATDTTSTVAAAIVSAINGAAFPGSGVTASQNGAKVLIEGTAFTPDVVATTALTNTLRKSEGALVQRTNLVVVYFNEDDLLATSAENPAYYQLINVADATVSLPNVVTYDARNNTAVLDFAGGIPDDAQYQLRVGVSELLESIEFSSAGQRESLSDGKITRSIVPGEIIVGLRGPAPIRDVAGFFRRENWNGLISELNLDRAEFLFDVSATSESVTAFQLPLVGGGREVEMAARFAALPQVAWAAPNYRYEGDILDFTPNDPDFPLQFHHTLMGNTGAWDTTLGDPSIVVAITDTGVDLLHPDLAANIWTNTGEVANNGLDDDANGFIDDITGWDFVTNDNDPNPFDPLDDGHGTHVAGISAAVTHNNVGVAGTAGGATIMPLRIAGADGGFTSAIMAATFAYAINNGARIANTSFNIDGFVGDPTFTTGLQTFYDGGGLHFNSAGNNNQLNPARQAFTQSLLVASSTSTDVKSSFSNYGEGVDITAPGSNIFSTLPNNTYDLQSGTSMSAPNAAGVAALIWSAHPTWTRDQVAAQLLGTADDIDALNPGFEGLLGSGRVNSDRAVRGTLAAPQIDRLREIPPVPNPVIRPISELTVELGSVFAKSTIERLTNWELRGDGADDSFGTADDLIVVMSLDTDYQIGTNDLTFSFASLADDHYRFTARSGGLTDPFGTPLNGDPTDPAADPFQVEFTIDQNVQICTGPDGFGYEACALAPDFTDISATGTPLPALDADDEFVELSNVALGDFEFDFYGATYSNLFVSSNGLITFGTGSDEFVNSDLSTEPSAATIAPFWDDLDPARTIGTEVFYELRGTGTEERLIVQWNDIEFVGGHSDGVTFQVILDEADGSIRFNYLDLSDGPGGHADEGGSATSGIKNVGAQGAHRLVTANNDGPNAFVGSNQSTLITIVGARNLYASVASDSPTNPGSLLTVDPSDGSGALVGDPVSPGGLSGLDFDSRGRLFGAADRSGGSSLVRIDANNGELIFDFGPIVDGTAPLEIEDLAFQPWTNVLFALQRGAMGAGLYRINTATAVATRIGTTPLDDDDQNGGLAFTPSGRLFMTTLGAGNKLIEINPSDGSQISSVPLGLANPDGMGIRPTDGVIFVSQRGTEEIFTLDTAGAATNLGPTGVGFASDLAFRPAATPPPLFSDDNSSFDTATPLGTAPSRGIEFPARIEPQPFLMPQFPGDETEPGHRHIPAESHVGDLATAPSLPEAIEVISYYFGDFYGFDPQGNKLFNEITEQQKERAREVFEIYAAATGLEFVETRGTGLQVITGDIRVLCPTCPAASGVSIASSSKAIMNGAVNWGEAEYGSSWQLTAFHEIGHSIGLGHSYDLPSIQGGSPIFPGGPAAHPSSLGFSGNPVEPVLTGDHDFVHAQLVHRPDSTDIDLYQFRVVTEGLFKAEIRAERLATTSLLDSVLQLYDENRNLIARNDDYFSNDSYLELRLKPGRYYLGVSSTGNTNYDPAASDTGFGGTTDGRYNLSLEVIADPVAPLVDTSRTPFDGDADGRAGGVFNFWFGTGKTLFVDKLADVSRAPNGNGTLGNPFDLIQSAISAATADPSVKIIRIVGNGDIQLDPLRVRPYLLGANDAGDPLADGRTFKVPAGVTVMIDEGALLKLQSAIIDVGSSATGIDRSHGALQVLGVPGNNVFFTAYGNDALGGDSDGFTDGARAGDYGGLVFRADSDFEDDRIFLNAVMQADISFGGGKVVVDSVESVFTPIHIEEARPTIAHNRITRSADAALSADPNSFADSNGRIGPDIHHNLIVDNSINALFVRIRTSPGGPIDRLEESARFDDLDVVHLLTENLEIVGNAGGPFGAAARTSGRLAIDPGIVMKMGTSRIETLRGSSNFLAEGTAELPIIFTSIADDRFGAGGTFDTTNDQSRRLPTRGDWGGLVFNAVSSASIDHAFLAFGGGGVPAEEDFNEFNVIEAHQAELRVTNSQFDQNASGFDPSTGIDPRRNGRGTNAPATIFVRGSQPILVKNLFTNNLGDVISVNANAMRSETRRDYGRSTGPSDAFAQFVDNTGPLVRLNVLINNSINGMSVRGEELTTQTTWDDTDVVHVLRDEITILNHHTFSGLRLQSSPQESLVVKLEGTDAGFTADGFPLDIDDRIGGTLQIVGAPGFPVLLTSLKDDGVGAGLLLDQQPNTDTNNDGDESLPTPGDWRSVRLNRYSNDRNVRILNEVERVTTPEGADLNRTPGLAEFVGILAPHEKGGDDNRPLGFQIHGFVRLEDPSDIDVYSFQVEAGTQVWIDVDRTGSSLQSVVELIDADGNVLASHDGATFGGSAASLIEHTYLGRDYYTVNRFDAGFRVVVPGPAGTVGTYFVRVSSRDGLTSGEYQLQVRLQQRDEIPGSTVRLTDMRYATNGIEVLGLPGHSPLLGESAETTNGNNNFGSAQDLGNLLAQDRNTISVGGVIDPGSNGADVDFYRFSVDYHFIQSIPGVNSGPKTWATIFDVDYADGFTGPDNTLAVFDRNGRLILVSRDSNVEDDQPGPGQGTDVDDLTRGTAGKLDSFIGTVQLPEGDATEYRVAVASNTQLPSQLNQTYQINATNSQVRLEPVNSLQRVAEDHIGFQGYTSGSPDFGTRRILPTTPLFDTTSALTLQSHVVPFDLSDVVLFVSQGRRLVATNAADGSWRVDVGAMFPTTDPDTVEDIAFRTDGILTGYRKLTGLLGTAGQLIRVDASNATPTVVGNDNVPDAAPTPPEERTPSDQVDALAYERVADGPDYDLYYSVRLSAVTGRGTEVGISRLYEADHVSGTVVAGAPNPDGLGLKGTIRPAGSRFATTELSFRDAAGEDALVTFTAIVPGAAGNGLVITIERADAANAITVVDNEITLQLDANPAPTAQEVIDLVNGNFEATRRLTASLTSGVGTANAENILAQRLVTNGGIGALRGPTTGLAFIESALYGITLGGDLLRIDKRTGEASVFDTGLNNLQGLTRGPVNLANGAFDERLFTISTGGTVSQLDTAGNVLGSASTNIAGVTGLAFSPLDFNLFHPTLQRRSDAGHGIHDAFDNSRSPNRIPRSIGGQDTDEGEGGASFYFGFEEIEDCGQGPPEYFTYHNTCSQLGVIDERVQKDLSTNPNIGNNYNLPGGALGALETSSFSLAGYDPTDRPTLYFNYLLNTEGATSTLDNLNAMRDSARVFVSTNGGALWQELATNNSYKPPTLDDPLAELPHFNSHSRTADVPEPRQRIQELFDNTNQWRQARVDLQEFAGQSNLMLRFEFATGGSFFDPRLRVDDSIGRSDEFGDFTNVERFRNNNFEGFYVDDILIGFAERGEMVTAAANGAANFFTVPQDPDPLAPTQIVIGSYQLELRRGTEYAAIQDPAAPDIIHTQVLDTNARLTIDQLRLGDSNLHRDQGHVQIEQNLIRDFSQIGILVDAGVRDAASAELPFEFFPTDFAHPGSPIRFDTLNNANLAPGVTLENNVVANIGQIAIRFGGDPNGGAIPGAPAPFGKIVNNTVYGGPEPRGVGIEVTGSASPTLANNIVAFTATGVLDNSSSPLVVATMLFQENTNDGLFGSDAIVLDATDPLFVDADRNNFYLQAGSRAIDSSLDRLGDRTEFVSVKDPLGIPPSDIFAPDRDLFGQLRVDDPLQDPPPGLGRDVFKDRGAVERADFVGPVAVLRHPDDNDPSGLDIDDRETFVHIKTEAPFREFIVALIDASVGIDDALIRSDLFDFRRNNVRLVNGRDYFFVYNPLTDEVKFLAPTAFPIDSIYDITIANPNVRDLAGNRLQANRGQATAFTIVITDNDNDPPENRVPLSQSVNEDTPLVFSTAIGNAIAISDPDAFLGANEVEVTLTADNGVLTLGNVTGLTFSTGDGIDDASMVFVGTIPDVNAALEGMTFVAPPDYFGAASLTITTNDLGNFVSPPTTPMSDTDTVQITVAPINDGPENQTPTAAQATDEDLPLVFSIVSGNAIQVADRDVAAGNGEVEVTLETAGALTLSRTVGLTFSEGDGTSDSTLTFRGLLADVNAALDGLSFTPPLNFNGTTDLTITTSDLGNFGAGGPLTDSDTISVSVAAVNDAPVNNIPARQTSAEDTALVLDSANGNRVSIDDVDVAEGDGILHVSLSVTNGVLQLARLDGLTFNAGDGVDDASMTFTGLLADVNAALDGLVFRPTSGFNGVARLTLTTDDRGNFGAGGRQRDSDVLEIDVVPVNDPPVHTVPGPQTTDEDVALVFNAANGNSISVADRDAGGGELEVTLVAANGTITLGSTVGLTFSTGDGRDDARLVFQGTLARLNAALRGLSFLPSLDFNDTDVPALGEASITITTNDLGNTGDPGPQSDTDQIVMGVRPINDAPVNQLPAAAATDEDLALIFSVATGNLISVVDVDVLDGDGMIEVTLSATGATVTLGSTTDLTFSTGDGADDSLMTFQASIDAANAALATITFQPQADFNDLLGTTSLTITSSDLGNSGAGGPLTDTDTRVISVRPVNDGPSINARTTETAEEDTRLAFTDATSNLISFSDIDLAEAGVGRDVVQVTLTAANGTVDLGQRSGLTFSRGDGIADVSAVFRGLAADVNAALATLTFLPDRDFNETDGNASLTLIVDDLGNTGAGGRKTDTVVIEIGVTPVNDAPVHTIPASPGTDEDRPLVFSTANGNRITVSDVDILDGTGEMLVTLLTEGGVVSIDVNSSLSFTNGDGTDDPVLTFSGPFGDVVRALNRVTFTPDEHFNDARGPSSLTFITNDLDNSGVGGQQVVTSRIPITVRPINDAPVNSAPASQTTEEDRRLVFSINNGNLLSVQDADAPETTGDFQVTLTATRGLVSVRTDTAVTFTRGDGVDDTTVTFRGPLDEVNLALSNTRFTPDLHFNSTDVPALGGAQLEFASSDLGNAGAGGRLTDNKVIEIEVTPVDDAPTLVVPGAQTTAEDAEVVFSTAAGNPISVADLDADEGDNRLEVTLTATEGTVTLATTNGLTLVDGDGAGDSLVTFQGTVARVNAALNGLRFLPTRDFNSGFGQARLTVDTNDLGNFGLGGPLNARDTIEIAVTSVNDAPIITAPATQAMDEDSSVRFSGDAGNQISVADVDASEGTGIVEVSLSADGALRLNGVTGLTFTAGDGTDDASMTFSGPLSAVNTALNGLTYTPALHLNGTTPITIQVDDLGNVGTGGRQTDSHSIQVTVRATNDAPVVQVPGAQVTDEDVPLSLNATNGNLVSISDVDARNGQISVELSAINGVLTLARMTGLTFTEGDGTADPLVAFSSTLANANAALANLSFRPAADFVGIAQVTVTVNDQGNTGGGSLRDSASFDVDVRAINDAPVNQVPGTQTVDEDSGLTFSAATNNLIAVSDVDAAAGTVQVTLTATNGLLSLARTTGLTLIQGDGVGDTAMTFSGSLNSVNFALNGLQFSPTPDFSGTARIDIASDDRGNSGAGTARTDSDTISINVRAVNDPPIAADDLASTPPGTPVVIQVADNDSDVDGTVALNSITIVAGNGPDNGTARANSNGTITYTPRAGFLGTDSFQYQIRDNSNAPSQPATVTIRVNSPPVARNDSATTKQREAVAIDVLANDSDPDGTLIPISVVVVDGPDNGAVTVDAAGVATYTPNVGFFGNDTFTYTVADNDGGRSNEATVSVTVTQVFPFQNPRSRFDVNDDGFVTAIDVLLIVNLTNTNPAFPGRLPDPPTADFSPPPYFDVNGDGSVSAIDAAEVASLINRRRTSPEAEASSASQPERVAQLAVTLGSAILDRPGSTTEEAAVRDAAASHFFAKEADFLGYADAPRRPASPGLELDDLLSEIASDVELGQPQASQDMALLDLLWPTRRARRS